jgi:RHS repeat-associated protein
VALSDVNSVLVERYTYDVFGRPTIRDANGTEIEASALGNPYLFTARAWDAETALYYYRARYYDYATARFLQPDPTGYSDGLNFYSYCGNDPVNFADPSGLFKEGASGFGWRSLRNIAVVAGTAVVVGAVALACPAVGAALAKVAPYLLIAGGYMGGEMLGHVITGEDMRGNPLSMRERGELLSDAGFLIGGSFLGAAQMQAATPGNVARIHGNSLDYVGETHVYAIKGPNGTYKIGQSMQGVRVRDGASIRGEAQARALTREAGDLYRSEIQRTFPDKASAREYETRLIERYRRIYGDDTLPGNKANR